MTDLEHRIRDRAHQLWVENGSPDNMAEHFWLLAERQIAEESAAGIYTAPQTRCAWTVGGRYHGP